MFIKLTKKDGSPVWINASFLVTVEPSRFGGSVVVPIGDGLDYDVRERPEEILALASGAPVPAVVPVPPPAALAVSRDPEPEEPGSTGSVESAPEAPKRKRAVRKTKSAKAAEEASAEDAPPPAEAPGNAEDAAKPAKKAVKPRAKAAAKKPKFEFPDDYLVRLRKLAPGSVRKFNNTLLSQFKIDNPEPVMLYLVDRKVIALENDHIIWLAEDSAAIPENVSDLVVG